MRKLMVIMAMALVLCGAFAMSAQADLLLDFSIPTPSSLLHNITLSDAGLSTNAGMFVPVNLVTGLVSPNSAPPLTIADGQLTFNTGAVTNVTSDNVFFAPGGQIKITGNIGFGIETLMLGTFVGTSDLDLGHGTSSGLATFNASFTDAKDEELLAHFGIPSPTELLAGFAGVINLQISGLTSPPTVSTTLNSLSGDVSNVPVPPAALLLGSGLLGLVGLRFRRKLS